MNWVLLHSIDNQVARRKAVTQTILAVSMSRSDLQHLNLEY